MAAPALRAALLQLDLLLDALQVMAFVVELLLLGICEHLVRLANLLEHLLRILPRFLVQVAFLVGMPFGSSFTVGLLNLHLRRDGRDAQHLVVVHALVFPEEKLGLLQLVVNTLLAVPLENSLELLHSVLVTVQGLECLRPEDVRLHKLVVAVGALAHVPEDRPPVFQSHAGPRALEVEARQEDRIVLARLDHGVQYLLRLLELAIVEGLLQLPMLSAKQPKPLAHALGTSVIGIKRQRLLQQLLALLKGITPLRCLHTLRIVAVQGLSTKDQCIDVPGVGPEHLLCRIQNSRVVFQVEVTSPQLQRQGRTREERLCLQVCVEAQRLGGLATGQRTIGIGEQAFPLIYLPPRIGEGGVTARSKHSLTSQCGPRSPKITLRDLRSSQSRTDLGVGRVQFQGLLAYSTAILRTFQH
mmetsp:Transcript_79521/g.178218  ORF Transcript_79521/g.178218 Transcript_79521/m.178218 type:complete len:414 (+) Transcript_79521:119-1360(+)